MRDLEKAMACAFQANYHLIWAVKYRWKLLLGCVAVRLKGVFKMIVDSLGYCLLAVSVHDGDHVQLFVSAPLSVCFL